MQRKQAKKRKLLAAIEYQKDFDIDGLLETVALNLKARGNYLAGYTQYEVKDPKGRCPVMKLRNLKTDETARISQAMGMESRGCRMDAGALAEFSGKLVNELEPKIQLLIINRFGKAETEGHGFRNVIEKAFAMEIPILTTVRAPYVEAWYSFCGELGETLPTMPYDILNWFDEINLEENTLVTMEMQF